MPRRPGERRRRRPWHSARGLSIFELLIAFVVLETGMMVAVQALLVGMEFGQRARNATYASLVAQAQVEAMLRDVVPELTPAHLEQADGTLHIPERVAPVLPPVGAEQLDVHALTWQGTVAATDLPGLVDVTVEVFYPGLRRRESVVLQTRARLRARGGG